MPEKKIFPLLRTLLSLILVLNFWPANFLFCAVTNEFPTSGKLPRSSIALSGQISDNPHVKVLILQESKHVTLAVPFPYTLQYGKDSITGNALLPSAVLPVSSGIQIGNQIFPGSSVKISTRNNYFELNGKSFHDDVLIFRTANGGVNVVNDVQLEDYLKGVLPWEVSEKWPMEALKAQAVASRTYALFKMLDRMGQDHILTADVLSQVYVGRSAEKPFTSQAVELTSGEILTFQNAIFPAFFHSACSGQTTDAHRVWRIEPNPVLAGVACPYCVSSKHQKWHSVVALKKIESQIAARGFTISPIKNITFSNYDRSGRAQKVLIDHQKGRLVLDANDFRLFVGPDLIRSTRAAVAMSREEAHFFGFGWGHGVGLCQWGTKAQAETGRTYQQILTFYYPGSNIVRLYNSRGRSQTTPTTSPASPPANQIKPAAATKNQSGELSLIEKAEKFVNDWIG